MGAERIQEACRTYYSAHSKSLFPLDLSGRVEWLRQQADSVTSPVERETIADMIHELRNGVPS